MFPPTKSANPFLQYPITELMKKQAGIGSGRYYARLGQAEFLPEDERDGARNVWLLEAIDAQWFDRFSDAPTGADRIAYYARAPLFLLELRVGRPQLHQFEALREVQRAQAKGYESPAWFEITSGSSVVVGSEAATDAATVYWNLYDPGIPVTLSEIRRVDTGVLKQLREATGTRFIPMATREQVAESLSGIGRIEWAVVYDVGQGNAVGLCRPDGSVAAYFDFGGGVLQNSATFPAGLQQFCFEPQPPIILSHWDWDHWSSANRDPSALRSTWIAPRQPVGPIHLAQMAKVTVQGQLLLVPANFGGTWFGQLYLERCTGKGRNHSGLALTFAEQNGGNGRRMLFPGDARYTALPSFSPQNDYCSVVVPHHGANMRNKSVPACQRYSHSRLAYSFGAGNTFGHPRNITRRDHAVRGWRDSKVSTPGPYEARETAFRAQSPTGHVLLSWQSLMGVPPLKCGGTSCHLQAQQL